MYYYFISYIKKRILPLIFTVVAIAVGIIIEVCCNTENPLLSFQVRNDEGLADIYLFQSEDCYYAFLPSYCSMDDVFVITYDDTTLDDISLSNGQDCGEFQINTEYEITIGNAKSMRFVFLQSANVGTVFINTTSKSMQYIHQTKGNSEYVSVSIYTANGAQDYNSVGCILTGRGQATWGYKKKPYTLTLPSQSSLLGMSKSSEWVLLANAADQTNLRNKLVYQFASDVGMEWAPSCEYVDLYLNGVYNGLYLLSEEPEAIVDGLQLEAETGDFLCKIDLDSRWDSMRNPFKTSLDRTVEVCSPPNVNRTQKSIYVNKVEELESIFQSSQDLNTIEKVDVDSWVRRYLIDTVFCNIDADLASSYFYCSDDVFYAGPVWDYDMSMGNNSRSWNPKAIYFENTYNALLRQNDSFNNHMVLVYQTVFLPKLASIIDYGIDEMASRIAEASFMNEIRWKNMFSEMCSSGVIYTDTADELSEYLKERVDFLNSSWIDGVTYCSVRLDIASQSASYTFSVREGEMLDLSDTHLDEIVWYDASNDTIVDLHIPILKNMDLKAIESSIIKQPEKMEVPLAKQDIIVLFFCIVLIMLFFLLGMIDFRRRK